MTERSPLERRILVGKVNVYDAIEYAEKHNLPKETFEDLQRATQEIYANVVPKRSHIPGCG